MPYRRFEREPLRRPRATGSYSEFEQMGWTHAPQGEEYYGTGAHYGGGFGTAPGTHASATGVEGAPGYASQGAWSEWQDRQEFPQLESSQPSFRGRGPKGYVRSDERLREAICERLTDDPDIDARDIEVEARDGIVTLKGTVDARRTKYAVEELVERCGASDIDNQLRVLRAR